MVNDKRKLICLTPVKNEAWVLEHFLKCAELWADHILIADQGSTDGSIEIAKSHYKVTLIENKAKHFNEPERQKLLIDEARKFGSDNILIALDADEAISANWLDSPEWAKMSTLPSGTSLRFRWVNILPDYGMYWSPKTHHAWGFIDNGSNHIGKKIHSPRVPSGSKVFDFNEIRVLHFQYIFWSKMQSKQRWYIAWEVQHNKSKSTIKLHRTYSHMYSYKKNNIQTIKTKWLFQFSKELIKLNQSSGTFWWDREVLKMFDEYGISNFANAPIWDISWVKIAEDMRLKNPAQYSDPRSWKDTKIQQWLKDTQNSDFPYLVKIIDTLLRILGR